MSHSAFRIIANDEPINRNLVIVVNKNGQVSTDTEALQNLLTSKGNANTGISILRETSPTPSISDEIELERSERYEMKRQEYLSAHVGEEIDEEELENQMRQITGSMDDEIPHVTLNVENFYTPDQARKFANDVLHLGGIDNPQSLMPIDFNFRRKTIQNDHCYTPLTQSPERTEKPQTSSKGLAKSSNNKTVKRESKQSAKARQQAEEESSDSGEAALDEDEECEEEQSNEEEEISSSESDDDNDIDFNLNDRFGKKGKKKRKYRKHKDKQRSMTFKDFLETGEVAPIDEEPRKKYTKSPKKTPVSRPSTSGKNVTSTPKNTQQAVVVKKMFQPQPFVIKNTTIRKETQPTQFVPLTVNFAKNNVLPGQISVQSSAPMKSKQEIEFVESIVKDLEKSFPENVKKVLPPVVTTTIPNIMQMMETTTPAEIIDQSLSTLEQLDSGDGAVPGIEEIGDAIIAVLGNEAIDELLNQNDLINFEPTQTAPIVKMTPNLITSSLLPTQSSSSVMSEAFTSSPVTTSQTPKILNKQTPTKDQIKVVRNGRVIVLPEITAPTTRGAKRRAQGDSPNTSITSPSIGKVAKTEKTPSSKDPDSKNSSRRSSLAKSDSGKSSRRQSVVQTTGAGEDELDDLNSDGSWASEDDPDRLWCICKQPHNNRFMICCDKCEDWFHGKCVNVTKAMGKEIELKGKEWRCPNCKALEGTESLTKKPEPKKKPFNQQKLTKFFAQSQKESTDEDVAKTVCVVCEKKPPRDSSIYCSDECIQNHATKHLDETTPQPKTPAAVVKSETTLKRGNVLKDKFGNVIVYDKNTGKILPLSKSPHFTSLGQWLSQNPNYKPLEPGTPQAEKILSKNRTQSQPQTPTATTTTTTSTPAPQPSAKQFSKSASAEDLFSNPVKINTGISPTAVVKKVSAPGQNTGNSGSVRSNVSVKNTSSSAVVRPLQTVSKPTNVSSTSSGKISSPKNDNKKPVKRQDSEEKPSSNATSKFKWDTERLKIRNTLKESLQKRMEEFDHPDVPKMTDEEIATFAKETEKEMFQFFSKETGDKFKMKYLAKYRSLKFNLNDIKNKTLVEKICAKKLTPKQLVELPPAALASEELSKWREDENKHQLEIITKSELDALAQNKIVVKTHKGEEIIEQKIAPADILVPVVDDIETVIAKTVLCVEDPHARYDLSKSISLNISGGNASSPLSSPSITSSTGRRSDNRHRSRSRSKSKGKDHHHHHKSSSKHKKSERHRSRSPKRHSSRDKDRKSRDKSRDKSHERSKSKKSSDQKHHRDKSKSKDTERSSGRSKDHKSKDSKPHGKPDEKTDVKPLDIQPEQQDVDIVGKILDSMGVHLDKPKASEVKDEKLKEEDSKPSVSTVVSTASKDLLVVKKEPVVQATVIEQKQEIEIYSGNMQTEISTFDFTASIVSGNFDDILNLLPPRLEFAGRIEPKVALDYLDRLKKVPGKEICILRFSSTDTSGYMSFFNQLRSKGRYGVIKSPQPKIKDFYVIPFEANSPLPKTLLPIAGPGFVEGEGNKPDLLLGVIVKVVPEAKLKRSAGSLKRTSSKSSRTPAENPIQSMFAKQKSSKLTMGLPEFTKTGELQVVPTKESASDANNDDNEPYTPFDDDDDVSNVLNYNATSVAKSGNVDLESEMEIVNREIEQRQMEIQTLAQRKVMELNEEQATRIYENINVPHNLSEILSTINKVQASEMKPMEVDDDDEEYVPSAVSGMEYRAASSYSAVAQPPIVNSMMDIDERIALFQRPDPVVDQPSRLASMTDADLMKLVPDDAFEAPPAPIISGENSQPSIPGLDGDDYEME